MIESKRLGEAKPSSGHCGGNGQAQDDGTGQNLALGEDWCDAEEEPQTEFDHPPILPHWRLFQHGEADEKNKDKRDAVKHRGSLFARAAEQGGAERGEESDDAGEVQCFENDGVHDMIELLEFLRIGLRIKKVRVGVVT